MTSAIKDQLNANKNNHAKNVTNKTGPTTHYSATAIHWKMFTVYGTKVMSQKAVPNWSFKSGQTNMYEDES